MTSFHYYHALSEVKKYAPLLFSLLLSGFYFSNEIILFLIGWSYFLILFWYSIKLVEDVQQALFPGLATVLVVGFLISTILGNHEASIALLNYFITGLITLALSQIVVDNFNSSFQDSINLMGLTLFSSSLILLIQFFQVSIYQFFESLALGIWWCFSLVLQWILSISNPLILYVVRFIVQILSQINFNNGTTQTIPFPENTPAIFEEDIVIQSGFNADILKQIGFFIFAIFLVLLILFIAKKILSSRKSAFHSETELIEVREMIFPKPKSIFPFLKKTKTEKLSLERENYKKAVNLLIKEGYAYLPSMTPLEYLNSIPLDKVIEFNLKSLTNAYLTARYRKK